MEKQFTLPIAVISPTDIARLLRELENLDEYFRQTAIREGNDPQNTPRYSRLLDEIVVENTANLLDEKARWNLIPQLEDLRDKAPVLHISFSVDPPGSYVQKIVAWLRSNIDNKVLVTVGLQPNIGAGCVVRSTNHTFDFSLRQYFETKHDFFMEKLHQVLISANQDNSMEASEVEREQKQEENASQAEQPEPVKSALEQEKNTENQPNETPQPQQVQAEEAPQPEITQPVAKEKTEVPS